MTGIRAYICDIYRLMGKSKLIIASVFSMGTLLGLMDLTCIALLTKLVAAISQAKQSLYVLPGQESGPMFSVTSVGYFLVVFYLARALLGISFNFTIFYRTGMIEADLRARLIERFAAMPYEQRLERSMGELVTSVNLWTASFSRSVLAPVLRCVCDVTVGLLILLYAAVLHPITVLLFLGTAMVLGFLYDRTLRRVATKNSQLFHHLSEDITENTQQALAGYKEIRVLGLVGFFKDKVLKRSRSMGRALAIMNTISQSSRLIIESIIVTLGIAVLLYYAKSGENLAQQLPQLAILTFIVLRISILVSLMTTTASNLRLYRGIVVKLSKDMEVSKHTEASVNRNGNFVSLETNGLSFQYQGAATEILSNLSFNINAGDALAIIGKSGVGKTTLVDILLGILKPTGGNINVMTRLGSIVEPRADLAGVASYLSQNAFLINDTLRRNVALGVADAQIDDNKVMDSLRKAKLASFAAPPALDRIVGDRGSKLSGGQRQRITLARAFYHGYHVMILDEATNAVDLPTEIEITQDLLALRPEVTVIAITHRPEIAKLFPATLTLSG